MDVSGSARAVTPANASPSSHPSGGSVDRPASASSSAARAGGTVGATREGAHRPFADVLGAAGRGRGHGHGHGKAPGGLGLGGVSGGDGSASKAATSEGALHPAGHEAVKREGEGDAEPSAEAAGRDVPAASGDEDEENARARAAPADESTWLDPSARQLAQLAPPGTLGHPTDVAATHANEPVRARSLEELLPALVRKIAWAGDRHKGTVRLELGAGAYAGTTVTVHADGGRVRVEIGGHDGPDLDRLRMRLDARLRGHGLDVESVT